LERQPAQQKEGQEMSSSGQGARPGQFGMRDEPYGPRKLDPVKAMIAQAVQHHLVSGKSNGQPPMPPKPDNVESAEGQVISPTETRVRVVTYNQGIRYFTVKVSENL
jgi:hypothetical protein